MKMSIMSVGMWYVFQPTFKRNLNLFGVRDAKKIMKMAKAKYKEIVGSIPPFKKNDILLENILSAAMVAAVYMSLPDKPDVNQMKEYYEKAMNESHVMRLVLKSTKNFSASYQKKLIKQAEVSQNGTNPYTWRFTFTAGETLDSFDAVFDRCGICVLFNNLGISEITPALCAYDYGMAKLTNTIFTRKYTLASGGDVCDCHFQRKE